MTRIPQAARELADRLAADGWTFAGHTGGGHLKFTHPSGAHTITSGTPGDRRALARALASARRRVREQENGR